MELVYRFGLETLVLPKPLADHRQRGCLYPSHGIRAASGGYRQRLCAVDAHQPVGFAAGFGGEIEVVILAPVLQFFQSFADGGVGQRAYPQPLERQGTADVGIQIPEYQFAFTGAVGRHDDAVALVPELGYHLDLLHRRRVRLVALVRLHLTGNQLEPFGDDGQAVAPEALDAVPVGQGKLNQIIAPTIRAISRATLGFSANMVIMSFSVLIVDTFLMGMKRGAPCWWDMRTRRCMFPVSARQYLSDGFSGGNQDTFMPLDFLACCFCCVSSFGAV